MQCVHGVELALADAGGQVSVEVALATERQVSDAFPIALADGKVSGELAPTQ